MTKDAPPVLVDECWLCGRTTPGPAGWIRWSGTGWTFCGPLHRRETVRIIILGDQVDVERRAGVYRPSAR